MSNAVKNSQEWGTFDPNRTIRAEYRRKLQRVLRRLRRKGGLSSLRRLAKKLGVSHTTLAYIRDNPEREVSRKTMLKIIRATKVRKQKRIIQAIGRATTSRCLVI